MNVRKLIGLHADVKIVEEIDAWLRHGQPGDQYYFASRSDFLRCAAVRLLADLTETKSSERKIRKRLPALQPVATRPTNA
jgi:Arc/MetJ-type ribon-helix-helix transcriptional regulator